MTTRQYRACGIELGHGTYRSCDREYSTAEEAWMRAQDDGIYPEWIESHVDGGWVRESYTPPDGLLYIDLYYLYVEGIIGDDNYSDTDGRDG